MLYVILKFVHVLAMAVWVGGMIALLILNRRLTAARETSATQAIGKQMPFVSTRIFMPSALITLITGIGMVHAGNLSFRTKWIIWGIVALIASFIVGGVFTGGMARKLGGRIAAGQITAAEIAATQRRIMLFSLINMLILLSTIFVMVWKPV